MSTLKIRLDVKDMSGGSQRFGVVAKIHPIGGAKGAATLSAEQRQEMQNLVIPVGNLWEEYPQFETVALPAGRYYVEALLPSEEAIGEEVLIPDDGGDQELRLLSESSPHEWLSWQRFSGNVVPAQQYPTGLTLSAGGTPLSSEVVLLALPGPPEDRPAPDGPAGGAAWLQQGFFFANPEFQEFLRTDPIDLYPFWNGLDLPGRVSAPLQPYASDPIAEIYSFDREYVDNQIGEPALVSSYSSERFERVYLFVRSSNFRLQYSALPLPWRTPGSAQEATIEALVLLEDNLAAETRGLNGLNQGFCTSVAVQDPLFGSLIAYLGAGQLQSAKAVFRQARDYLFAKGDNPFAAAAGAYVLIANPDPQQPDYWHGWVRNLMNRYPWLPDGAILYGRLLLGQSRDPQALQQARACYLEGFRRGLPFFSKGVGYLLDGLTRFANDARRHGEPDGPIEAALAVVRELAIRINMRQPFTSVLLDLEEKGI